MIAQIYPSHKSVNFHPCQLPEPGPDWVLGSKAGAGSRTGAGQAAWGHLNPRARVPAAAAPWTILTTAQLQDLLLPPLPGHPGLVLHQSCPQLTQQQREFICSEEVSWQINDLNPFTLCLKKYHIWHKRAAQGWTRGKEFVPLVAHSKI